MTDYNYFWEIMCMLYFVGGLGIGWLISSYRYSKKKGKSGTGRWDYKDRHLGDGDFREK